MTDAEWAKVIAVISANWPSSPPPEAALQKWKTDLDDIQVEQVVVAIEALYRDGREFCPNGGQIRKKVVELAADTPGYGEAWELLQRAVRRFGADQEQKALKWIDEQDALAARAIQQIGWRAYCTSNIDDEPTWRAQFRQIYEAIADRTERDAAYDGLPSAGLKTLERGKSDLRRIGELVRGKS